MFDFRTKQERTQEKFKQGRLSPEETQEYIDNNFESICNSIRDTFEPFDVYGKVHITNLLVYIKNSIETIHTSETLRLSPNQAQSKDYEQEFEELLRREASKG